MQTLVVLVSLAMSGVWTAQDPFVGTWKLDPGRSVLIDQMQIEAAGPGRYTFKFEGGPAETIVADGSFQPGVLATTLAATAGGTRFMRVERKKDGRTMLVAHWTVARDGRSLQDEFTTVNADGSSSVDHLVYQRKAGRSGFLGRWERTTSVPAYELKIRPYGDTGLSFDALGGVKSVTFDGKDHALAAPGATASGRRSDKRVLQMTDRIEGRISDTRTYRLSADGKVLTLTIRPANQTRPNVLVYERT